MGMTIACPKCGRKLVWSMLFRWLQCEKLLDAKGRECDPLQHPRWLHCHDDSDTSGEEN